MLRAIIMWIYRMDLPMVLLLLAVFTIIFHTVHSQFIQYKFWKPAVILFLFLWAVIVLFLTIFQRTQDVSLYPIWQPFQSYVDALKEDGQKELMRSNFMNAVLFYPAGLLLASLLPEKWHAI